MTLALSGLRDSEENLMTQGHLCDSAQHSTRNTALLGLVRVGHEHELLSPAMILNLSK